MGEFKAKTLIEGDGIRVPREDVQNDERAACVCRLLLYPLHERARDAALTIGRRNIQRDDISGACFFGVFEVKNAKAGENAVNLSEDNESFLRLREPPHRTAREAERALKADHVERVHRVEIAGPVAAQGHSKPLSLAPQSRYDKAMPETIRRLRRHHPVARAVVEIAFIIFLFYANLLMGEFDRSNHRGKTISYALHDIFTRENFLIALISALVGYLVFEYLRGSIQERP
jgi:hypothetical protein